MNQTMNQTPLAELATTISRSEARAAGLLTYLTGKPCRRGHLAGRYVSCGNCVECQRENDEARAASGEQAERHRQRMAAGEIGEKAARRYAGPRCPRWVSSDPGLVQQMREVYALAQRLGAGWHVDHLVPLKGRNAAGEHVVSGLHVPWNLRVRPAGLNVAKGSRFDLTDPDATAWEFETEEALCAHYAVSEHWSCNPLTPEDLARHAKEAQA